MNELLMVTTTFETKEEAEQMAKIVLDKRLAACAQVSGPIASLYWWHGKIENTQEYILTLKTTVKYFKKLEQIIKDNHPYDLPEIIATQATHSSREYKDWLNKELIEK